MATGNTNQRAIHPTSKLETKIKTWQVSPNEKGSK